MSEQTFRNRRGNKVSISDAVAEIESEKVTPPTAKAKPNKEQPAKKNPSPRTNNKKSPRPRRALLRIPKKVAILIAAIVFLLALVGLLVVDGAKREYESQTAAMRRNVTDITTSPSSRETPAVAVTEHLLESLDRSADCKATLDVTQWYAPAARAQETCQTVAENYEQLRQNVQTMRILAVYASEIEKSLDAPLQNPNSGTFASIVEYTDRWEAVVEKLEDVTPPDAMKGAHTKLVERVGDVRDNWQSLRTANAEQERASFEQAEEQLTDSYVALRSSHQDIVRALTEHQRIIDEQVQNLSFE